MVRAGVSLVSLLIFCQMHTLGQSRSGAARPNTTTAGTTEIA